MKKPLIATSNIEGQKVYIWDSNSDELLLLGLSNDELDEFEDLYDIMFNLSCETKDGSYRIIDILVKSLLERWNQLVAKGDEDL